MPGNHHRGTGTPRQQVETRSGAKKGEKGHLEKSTAEAPLHEASVQNMATGGQGEPTPDLSDLYKIMVGLDEKVSGGFAEIKTGLAKVTDKIEALEIEMENVKTVQENDRADIEDLKEEIGDLRQSLLVSQVYSRKYHLLLYGVSGQEKETADAIERVRKFAREDLHMDGELVENLTIRNAHRLRQRPNDKGPAAIIVVFVYWEEREQFLRQGKELKGTTMSVRTDLPPVLKQKRGRLAHEAYLLRNDPVRKIQARVREKIADIWIETRKRDGDPWIRMG